jgi:hypothetical protein
MPAVQGRGHLTERQYGLYDWVMYGAAKGAQTSLARGLAIEGEPHNIKVNALAPLGVTINSHQALENVEFARLMKDCQPRFVAPLAVFLVSEDVPVSGHCFSSGGGHITEFVYGSQEVGQCPPEELTPEHVAQWVGQERGPFKLQRSSADQMTDFFGTDRSAGGR